MREECIKKEEKEKKVWRAEIGRSLKNGRKRMPGKKGRKDEGGPQEDREAALKEAGLRIEIRPNHALAMKADPALPWAKMRAISKYITVRRPTQLHTSDLFSGG